MKPRQFGAKKPRDTKRARQITKAINRAVHEYKASFSRLAAE